MSTVTVTINTMIDTPVTHSNKCYVYVCCGCDLLDTSSRSDALTCSTACRVRAHRNGCIQTLRKLASSLEITPASIKHVQAIERLRPDLYKQIEMGKLTIDEAQPEVCRALWNVLQRQLAASS